MGYRFLCSRSELFRSLDLDTGIRPLFISPQEGFMEWIDKVIPVSSLSVSDPGEIPESEIFDLVLIWPRNGRFPEREEMIQVLKHVSNGERIWAVLPSEIRGKESDDPAVLEALDSSSETILLSTRHIIMKMRTDHGTWE
jgi:hypothetical protein